MKYLINLFPVPKKTTSEKIIYFATHYLKYILVITQFVAICVFFFRFKVDQEIVDLKDKLHQKQSILDATDGLISRIQEIDSKMKNVQVILKEQDQFKQEYTYFFSVLPQGIEIGSLEITPDKIALSGVVNTVNPIRSLYNKLVDDGYYAKVNLVNIEKKEDGFNFDLELSEYSHK